MLSLGSHSTLQSCLHPPQTFPESTQQGQDSHLQPAIKETQASDLLATDMKSRFLITPNVGDTDLSKCHEPGGNADVDEDFNKQWNVILRVVTYEGMIYVPADTSLCNKVISHFHDNPASGNFRALRTAELVARDVYCPAHQAAIRKFIATCAVCNQIMKPHNACHEFNMSLLPPSAPWRGIPMDFGMDLMESKASGCTGIVVNVDRLAMMAIYRPC